MISKALSKRSSVFLIFPPYFSPRHPLPSGLETQKRRPEATLLPAFTMSKTRHRTLLRRPLQSPLAAIAGATESNSAEGLSRALPSLRLSCSMGSSGAHIRPPRGRNTLRFAPCGRRLGGAPFALLPSCRLGLFRSSGQL